MFEGGGDWREELAAVEAPAAREALAVGEELAGVEVPAAEVRAPEAPIDVAIMSLYADLDDTNATLGSVLDAANTAVEKLKIKLLEDLQADHFMLPQWPVLESTLCDLLQAIRGVQLHPSTGKHHEDGVTFSKAATELLLEVAAPTVNRGLQVFAQKQIDKRAERTPSQPEPFSMCEHERRLQEQVPALMAFLYRCTFSSAQVAGQKRSRESLQLMQQRVVGVASVLVYSISRSASDFQRSVGTQLVTRGKDGRLKLCNTFGWAISDDAVKKMLRDSNVFDVDSVFQPHESIHAATDNYEQKMLHTYLHSLVRNSVLHMTTLTAWRQSRVDVPRD
ncbi:hypothetical protein CYMTET_36851 [Cymbomonas tetramitiformis]|uniref:Uncharacterized protein n=1 Tax=Cymbomonas tetramitiformis TaxID=36881 RepID=A0AAE0CF65_9CHLO|nr:hypothetical protein CYMTET_36851 [Cymbomonas tetramitiformis]